MSDNDKQDEKETEKPKNKITAALSPRGARLREQLLSKIVPWEKITVSLNNFPYYIDKHSQTLLLESVELHVKHNLSKYGGHLKSSSHRILLQSLPGTELYREKLVTALAREMQVPLLKVDLDYVEEEDYSDDEDDSDDEDSSDDEIYSDDEDSSDDESDSDEEDDSDDEVSTDESDRTDELSILTNGDRVKYLGKTISIEEANNRTLSSGQRGEVYEVIGERVAVIFNICGLEPKKPQKDAETFRQALVAWLDVKDVKHDRDARTHDCYIAMEVLYEVLESQKPVIVYFPDSFLWPCKKSNSVISGKVKKIFDRLPEGVVIICAQNKFGPAPRMPKFMMKRTKGQVSGMHKLFTNVVCINPPKIEEDMLTVIREGNLSTMHKILKDHNLSCMNLELPGFEDVILTRKNADKIAGWAKNHYLSSCPSPCVNDEKLNIPPESIKHAISRLAEEDKKTFESKHKLKTIRLQGLASGPHEKMLAKAVVFSEDIGVKFDDVGALENVKKVLHETIIFPIRRPELFSHGNLLRCCKGILLFGPPGTGKTLVAKALATESGANFINITASILTSKCWGETESITAALFSYATKLAPVIIFLDEVDSLLGGRGDNKHHHTSRLNEFMAAWDGLTSKEVHRIIVIGTTNRPYDIDEAVIRRMPRRIYVGLPDVENRCKILKKLLKEENLESGFCFEQLAKDTEGYSGSDLKNLCVAAAFKPIEEIIEQESKGEASDGTPTIRPLNLNDFLHSKAKVRSSVTQDATGFLALKHWNMKFAAA